MASRSKIWREPRVRLCPRHPDLTDPVLGAADGTVTVAEFSGGYGGLIVIEQTISGKTFATAYAHMWQSGINVRPGDRVSAGQHIGDVGSSGMSTGTHLHFEVRPGGTNGEAIDAAAWLNEHRAANLPTATIGSPAACNNATAGTPTRVDGDPDRFVDDPTSSGKITARMLHLYQQTLAAFPDTGWGCYSPRPGTKSEHPLGRACDITFGNRIGQQPTPAQLAAGWKITNWMKDNADVLGVEYLIWQSQIWSLARNSHRRQYVRQRVDVSNSLAVLTAAMSCAGSGARFSMISSMPRSPARSMRRFSLVTHAPRSARTACPVCMAAVVRVAATSAS